MIVEEREIQTLCSWSSCRLLFEGWACQVNGKCLVSTYWFYVFSKDQSPLQMKCQPGLIMQLNYCYAKLIHIVTEFEEPFPTPLYIINPIR